MSSDNATAGPGAIARLRDLLAKGFSIHSVKPAVFASDAEINIVTVTLVSPDGSTQSIRAYREEAQAVREFLRSLKK